MTTDTAPNTIQETTLSPALAGIVAQLTIPQQYATVLSKTIAIVNQSCRVSVSNIAQ